MYTLRWLRMAALGALSFSAAAAADGLIDTAPFCAAGSGCEQVRGASLGRVLGPYLPFVGLGVYALVFFGSLARTHAQRRPSLWLGILGGVGGLGLLFAQWITARSFCGLCVGADLAAIMVAVLAVQALRRPQQRATGWPLSAWLAMFVMFAGAPPIYALSLPMPVPDFVRSRSAPERVDIIEVSDFQCPSCRALHEVLAPVVANLQTDVELNHVRLSFPLAMHLRAEPAARAHLCALEQGKGEAMASALFRAEKLKTARFFEFAERVGLEPAVFKRCFESQATRARVQAVKAELEAGGVAGVPLVWIEGRRFRGFNGAVGAVPYQEALRDAVAGRPVRPEPLPFIGLGLAAAALVTWATRRTKLGAEA